jgi:beta-lactamase regulating signal transducer with metallopeptidase domain
MIELLVDAAVRSLVIGVAVGLALRVLRVRNPQIEMTAWITVLGAALAMPLLLRWPVLSLPTAPITLPAEFPAFDPAVVTPSMPDAAPGLVTATMPDAAEAAVRSGGIDIVQLLYLAIAGLLLTRLAIGLARTWRMVRRAEPIRGDWTGGRDVRVTDAVTSPVTVGRTILLPVAFAGWSPAKRRAVLSHEASHLEHHDFVIQLASAVHAALFWFNPLAWWLQLRLAFLAERTSDEAAIARVGSRVDYAEILLELAVGARGVPLGIAMARPTMLRQRVESLLSGDAVPAIGMAPLRRTLLVLALLPGMLLIGGTAWHARAADPVPDAPADRTGQVTAGDTAESAAQTEVEPGAEAAAGSGHHYDLIIIQHDGHIAMVNGSINVSDDRISVHGAGPSVDKFLNDHGRSGTRQVLFERDGIFYRSTDAGLLGEMTELMRPQEEVSKQEEELGRQQGELGRQQGELGRQQGDFGRRQGEIGRQQGEVGRQMADLARHDAEAAAKHARALAASLARSGQSDEDRSAEDQAEPDPDIARRKADLNRQMRDLGRQQGDLGEQQRALGERQRALGEQQRVLGEAQRKLGNEQEKLARDAEAKMHILLDQAIANVTATPLP